MKQLSGLRATNYFSHARFARHALAASIAAAFGGAGVPAWAQLPTGMQVINGTVGVANIAGQMTITNTPDTVLNWQTFSIGAANRVRFEQANTASKVLNRVVGNDPSHILGSLSSNGAVWLINPHGVLFGSSARVNVAQLVAATLNYTNEDFLSNRFRFNGSGTPGTAVQNEGEITASSGGRVWLVGASVANTGVIDSAGGHVALAAGTSVEFVDSGLPHLNLRVTASNHAVENSGTILAADGKIDLFGGIVNQQGIVRATSLNDNGGIVNIVGEGNVTLKVGSVTTVEADDESSAPKAGALTIQSKHGALLVEGRVSTVGESDAWARLVGSKVTVGKFATIDVSGDKDGGTLSVLAENGLLLVQGEILSKGHHGNGGTLTLTGSDVTAKETAKLSASGTADGGTITLESRAGTILVHGSALESGGFLNGGTINLIGSKVGVSEQAKVDASGERRGGTVNIAADRTLPSSTAYVGPGALVQANAGQSGDGGTVNVGSSGATRLHGTIEAQGGAFTGSGGTVTTRGRFVDASATAVDASGSVGTGSWKIEAGKITIGRASTTPSEDLLNFDVPSASVSSVVPAELIARALARGITVDVKADSGSVPAGTTPLAGDVIIAANIQPTEARPGGKLILRAQHDVVLNEQVSIDSSGTPLNVELNVYSDSIGTGGIRLLKGSRISTTGGSLFLHSSAPGQASKNSIVMQENTVDAGGNSIYMYADLIDLRNARISSSSTGDAVLIETGGFSSTNSQLSTDRGRWLLYLEHGAGFPADALSTLDYRFVQVNADASIPPILSGPGQNGVLMKAPLDVRIKVNARREYDGTVRARFSEALSSDAPSGFRIQSPSDGPIFLEGSFQDKSAGLDKPITYDGDTVPFFLVTTADVPVYGAELSYVGDVTPRPVSVTGLTAASKIYDANRNAAVTGSLSNVIDGDRVSLSGLSGQFDTKNAGTAKTVTVTVDGLSGADAGNYTLSAPATTTADITQRPISTAGIGANGKVYDGTLEATLNGGFADALPGDVLAIGTTSALFDTKDVGTDKTVRFTNAVLAGTDAANYTLTGPLEAKASITPRPVSIGITGQVQKEYDASAKASLGASQFALNGVLATDAVAVSGPVRGNYDTANAGRQKTVTVTGRFDITGADAFNYSVDGVELTNTAVNTITATTSGNVGTITPATLVYVAEPAVREAAIPVMALTGTVTGFKGEDTLATATNGVLLWESVATQGSAPGTYAITGTGLSAANYEFVQAPGNAAALLLRPNRTLQSGQESSTTAITTAVQSALPAPNPIGSGGGVFDVSSPAASRTFSAVRIGSMNQEELAQMLAQRREFKRKLFAEAIYKLEIDPSLADVRPCATVVEASSGACRITAAQLELIHAAKPQATTPLRNASTKAASLPQIERKIAVLFGINDYQDSTIPRLENAVPDVDAVSRLFADKLGYEVRVLHNPSKADIIRTLNALSTEINSSDSVVVYYAGHGYSLEKNGAGYWLPSDAAANDPRQWVSNNDVAKLLSGIRSRQMALISDSCYSGAFAREGMDAVGRNVNADDVLAKRSVVVLSSGGDEPVADEGKDNHSIFAWNLMQVVGSVANWKPGSTVFDDVQAGVRKEFPQTPKYGAVTAAGHQTGGDYLFELRSK